MKKLVVFGVLAVLTLTGMFFYFSGKEYTVKISESQIQQKLSEKMPISQSYLMLLRATFDNPRVKLTEDSDRIHAGLDVELNLQLANVKKPFGGSVDVSGTIRYVASAGSFYLTNPKIEKLTVEGFPDKYLGQATILIEKLLSKYYETHPIYTLKSTDAKQKGMKMLLKRVTVENKHLIITLGI